ncbi:MbtH family NRPS accessory protein [Streptomyces sp. cg36]|uniref:MbtH family NRPS accessory protein n=1 Tax=Streptomyces sp. cg36 TaxID=3238798 RepID=UPI0034E2AE93
MTVPGPFESHGEGVPSHLVLTNAAGERSLWPAFAPVPAGWDALGPAADFSACRTRSAASAPAPAPSGART